MNQVSGKTKLLLCCEFYPPSVGGVQEVMRQLARRLVRMGYDVTVVTTRLAERTSEVIDGVKIRQFEIGGNLVRGMNGDVDSYRDFVVRGGFDLVMIKAAQQWTFDALWPVLGRIACARVFIPCGFSCLFEPAYASYYREMPRILGLFDHLVFYASDYRDIDFARKYGLKDFSIIPNGADAQEFSVPADPGFRKRHAIDDEAFLFLTVGSFTGCKGHLEVAEAYELIELDRPSVLILNGNTPHGAPNLEISSPADVARTIREFGMAYPVKYFIKKMLKLFGIYAGTPNFRDIAARINKAGQNKRVLIVDLPRAELVQAFISADLFVFASNIEYSPLVLYESAAAGTPFLTVPVGNSAEIAYWTKGGVVCPADKDELGYTRVRPEALAAEMKKMADSPELLAELAAVGRESFQKGFTWDVIARQYEDVFGKAMNKRGEKPEFAAHPE